MAPKTFFAVTAVALLAARSAAAETHGVAPAGGGLPALDVSVDLAVPAVSANGVRLPIPIDGARLPVAADVLVEPVAIGRGRTVVHVRVPLKGDALGLAWEAILAAGRREAIFAGMTGLTGGDPGERTGKAVQIVSTGAVSFVLVGDIREDLGICGRSRTLLEPLALYPASMDLRPATFQRLSAAEQATARQVVATAADEAPAGPLAKLLVARGSSVPDSRGGELTDGDLQTQWTERRPGAGQGEFVVMAAPRDVPVTRLRLVMAPPSRNVLSRSPNGAAPRTLYLVTTRDLFAVTVPEDARLKSTAYDIALQPPIEATCITLVLDSAYTRGLPHPDVSIAEVQAFSEFDVPGATLDDVAAKLSGERGTAAAQVLERAGQGALDAVAKAFGGLDARGRALAIDVAAVHEPCDEAAPLLARGLCGHDDEVSRKAREKLERCRGAAPSLARAVRDDRAARACLAPTLAAMAPLEALDPIADALAADDDADRTIRAVLRTALAGALKAAPPPTLAAMLSDASRSPAARLEIMRAAEGLVSQAAAQSEVLMRELLSGSPPMRTRYLVLGPLEELAHAGDSAASARLAQAIAHDPDWPVRARAADAAAGVVVAAQALVSAAHDPEPRVREAALRSFAVWPVTPPATAIDAAKALLRAESWSFVRAQAVGVLAKAPPAAAGVDDALGGALHDTSAGVRGAALVALAQRRAWSWRKAIRERLDDAGEDVEVRAAAARAEGAVCDREATDRLTRFALVLGAPGTGEDEQTVALAALEGLATLQPRDLRQRLAPLAATSAPPFVRVVAEHALAARPDPQRACEPESR